MGLASLLLPQPEPRLKRPDKTTQRPLLANFDPVAEIYDERREKLSEVELRFLTDELQGSRTLEIAVGTGRLAKPLQDRGIDITGIDVSTRMLSRAKEKGTRHLVRGEVTHLPFKDSSFDAVLVVHFLHLVPDWPGLIGEITRVAEEKLVSVDSRASSKAKRPRELYLEMLEKTGYPPPVKTAGELLLAEKVKPSRMELIEKVSETGNMDKMLDMLEKKWLAVTWTVPDGLHRELVQELRKDLMGKTIDFTYENFLLVWKVEDLSKVLPYL